jgi:hypothetical protein
MKTIVRLLSAGIVFSLLALIVPQSVLAIGVSPSSIDIDSLLEGVPLIQSVNISRSSSDYQGDLLVNIEVRGEYPEHLHYEQNFILPQGDNIFTFDVEILATDVLFGDYTQYLAFYTEPAKGHDIQTGVIIRKGVEIPVNYTVSNIEVVEYELNNITGTTTEVGQDMIVNLFVKNTGNTTWQADRVIFEFVDTTDENNAYTYEFSGTDTPAISPANQGDPVDIAFKHNIPAGNYIVRAIIYENNEVVGELTSKDFYVFQQGTLAQMAEVEYFKTNKTSYLPDENIQLETKMANTGEISVNAVMVVDVYKDGTLIDFLRSDPLTFSVHEQGLLTDVYKLSEPGVYTFSSYVSYGNKRTIPLELDVEIVGTSTLTTVQMTIILAIICIVLLVLALIRK